VGVNPCSYKSWSILAYHLTYIQRYGFTTVLRLGLTGVSQLGQCRVVSGFTDPNIPLTDGIPIRTFGRVTAFLGIFCAWLHVHHLRRTIFIRSYSRDPVAYTNNDSIIANICKQNISFVIMLQLHSIIHRLIVN
jgi:hypothetical protein